MLQWSDHSQLVYLNQKLYLLGGRSNYSLASYSIGVSLVDTTQPFDLNQRLAYSVPSKTMMINTTTRQEIPLFLVGYFGMSCVSDEQRFIYCTGGFPIKSNLPFLLAENNGIQIDTDTGYFQQFSLKRSVSGDTQWDGFKRAFHSSVYSNGFIYVFGGQVCHYCYPTVLHGIQTILKINVKTADTTILSPVPTGDGVDSWLQLQGFTQSCVIKLDDSKFLLFGGKTPQHHFPNDVLSKVFVYDSSLNTISIKETSQDQYKPSFSYGASCVKSGSSLFIYGGCDQRLTRFMSRLDLGNWTWTLMTTPPKFKQFCGSTAADTGNYVVFHGGLPVQDIRSELAPADYIKFLVDGNLSSVWIDDIASLPNEPTTSWNLLYVLIPIILLISFIALLIVYKGQWKNLLVKLSFKSKTNHELEPIEYRSSSIQSSIFEVGFLNTTSQEDQRTNPMLQRRLGIKKKTTRLGIKKTRDSDTIHFDEEAYWTFTKNPNQKRHIREISIQSDLSTSVDILDSFQGDSTEDYMMFANE